MMVENLEKLLTFLKILSNVLEVLDSMKFNIYLLYEKVLKDYRKTVYFMQEYGILCTRLRCPDRQCSIFENTKVPDPETA